MTSGQSYSIYIFYSSFLYVCFILPSRKSKHSKSKKIKSAKAGDNTAVTSKKPCEAYIEEQSSTSAEMHAAMGKGTDIWLGENSALEA